MSSIFIDKDTNTISDSDDDTLYFVNFVFLRGQPSEIMIQRITDIVGEYYQIIRMDVFPAEDGTPAYNVTFSIRIPPTQAVRFMRQPMSLHGPMRVMY